MDKRVLGKDLEVSEIEFGCMGMSHARADVAGVWRLKNTEKIDEVSNEKRKKDNHRDNSGFIGGSHSGLHISVYRD